ncbi:hypothetical protein FSP39_000435 [Pinctada imbricata]|uniref:Uncharacterized protein n=1 Tax=Pinctada imbricata TaxID=66713 RepID=A0AA89C4D0_PINIB|nr:hypothetical protein FSP39_000435 [Pinctada imbricata]
MKIVLRVMEGPDETDHEVKEIQVDDVLGELRDILKDKCFGDDDESSEDDEIKEAFKDVLETEARVSSATEAGSINKTDEEKMEESGVASSPPVSPGSHNAILDKPIFFKTSIKKDPGSKLHDQLVKELGSVLKKRAVERDPEAAKVEEKKNARRNEDVEERKQISADKPVGKILQNKVLLANLENHLKRSLHKINIKQRSSLEEARLSRSEDKDVNEIQSVARSLKHRQVTLEKSDPSLQDSELSIAAKSLKHVQISTGQKVIASHAYSSQINEKVLSSKSKTSPKSEKKKSKTSFFKRRFSKDKSKKVPVEYSSNDGKHVTYIQIAGCPYVQNIDEGGMPTAHGNGLHRGEEDKVATFCVDVGQRQGDLDVRVDGPNSIAKTTIEREGDQFVVTYVPVEVGLFDINITWNGRDIPGSPYHPKVLDARKIKISGGWGQYMDASERVALVVGEEKKLIFDVSQAGPGSLRSEVVGPNSNIPVAVEENYGNTVVSFVPEVEENYGNTVVSFVPEVEGNHYIHLFWSDFALPSSPFLGYAISAQPDSNKVILTGRGLKEATVREEAEFVIDGSQAGPGKPEVTLTGVRAEISVRVVGIGNGKYRCSYIPVVPGAYLLHITWNGRQLRGSPYKVNVIGAFYPNKVQVSGEGLRGGILGRSMEVFIDTRKAGPGELTAYCMGPNKAAYCELIDNKDGTFVLRIKPLEVGRHVLQVKYGGEHVNGSPFVLKVAAQPDASKVRVTGPGVEHGILATYQSRFIVETRGAGAGQLTVRIRGPKGGFQVEMYRDSQKDRTILCRYDPTETGLYIISIKWSGVDVPGSPFQVNIVDTQQELEQVLQESFSHSSVSQRSYSQWRQEI